MARALENMMGYKMAIKAILFDCDGVLIDSEPMGCESLAIAMTRAGIPMDKHEAATLFCGFARAESIERMNTMGVDGKTVYDAADRILFDLFEKHVPLVEGIEDVLATNDLSYAVCSNSSVSRLNLSICKTHIAKYFGHHIYSGESVKAPKPSPDLALFALKQLGISPSDAVFIDDNIQGIRCGRDAGCLTVGFVGPSESRPNHEQILRNEGAHYVVHSLREFQTLIGKLKLPLSA